MMGASDFAHCGVIVEIRSTTSGFSRGGFDFLGGDFNCPFADAEPYGFSQLKSDRCRPICGRDLRKVAATLRLICTPERCLLEKAMSRQGQVTVAVMVEVSLQGRRSYAVCTPEWRKLRQSQLQLQSVLPT